MLRSANLSSACQKTSEPVQDYYVTWWDTLCTVGLTTRLRMTPSAYERIENNDSLVTLCAEVEGLTDFDPAYGYDLISVVTGDNIKFVEKI